VPHLHGCVVVAAEGVVMHLIQRFVFSTADIDTYFILTNNKSARIGRVNLSLPPYERYAEFIYCVFKIVFCLG